MWYNNNIIKCILNVVIFFEGEPGPKGNTGMYYLFAGLVSIEYIKLYHNINL